MRLFASNSNARRARKAGGFTLPEMIVVVAITAIMAATAAPSLLNLGSTRCAAAARQLVRDLTFARQRSIATGTRHWVVFNTSTQTWSVLIENINSPGRSGATALNDLASGRPFVQTMNAAPFSAVSLTAVSIGGASEIGFDWQGKPLNASEAALTTDGTVTFTGSRTVTIKANTGYATTP
jgi:prepilin-type N-terminal cleavage/methylation domain-containing protein